LAHHYRESIAEAQKLQPLLADWERDVDAEAKRTQPATASAR
jgi:hypothetical protein